MSAPRILGLRPYAQGDEESGTRLVQVGVWPTGQLYVLVADGVAQGISVAARDKILAAVKVAIDQFVRPQG